MTSNALFRSTSNVATVAKLAASAALSLSLVSFAQAQGLPDFTTQTVTSEINMPWGMVWLPNADMLVTARTGDRGDHFVTVQDLSRDGGKNYRINDDGSIPADNPFVNTANALPAIWSFGHRNPQGIDIHPLTGEIWASEHGPRGGDEINIARAGLNYGWPNVGYGINYNGQPLAERTHAEGIKRLISAN